LTRYPSIAGRRAAATMDSDNMDISHDLLLSNYENESVLTTHSSRESLPLTSSVDPHAANYFDIMQCTSSKGTYNIEHDVSLINSCEFPISTQKLGHFTVDDEVSFSLGDDGYNGCDNNSYNDENVNINIMTVIKPKKYELFQSVSPIRVKENITTDSKGRDYALPWCLNVPIIILITIIINL